MKLQDEIDKEYPPTHTFSVSTLEPTKVLQQRVSIIEKYFPDFFKGERLLDIGCSFGYFSLSNSSNFKEIVGIDNNKRSIEICNELNKSKNTEFVNTSFRNFTTDKQFDKIFLGNVHHHIFKEINGHEWISKLAAISSNEVLIEGPVSIECPDFSDFPEHFNKFLVEMNKYFEMPKVISTVDYTPKRFFTYWKRKPFEKVDFKTIEKKYKKDAFVDNNKVDIFLASTSPISNGLVDFKSNGWLEKFETFEIYKYFENEEELFKLHCDHQVYLSKLGYFDMDSATINFFKNNKLFDKSGIIPISEIRELSIHGYFKLLNQSYETISSIIQDKIKIALKTKDSIKIEEVFRWAKSQINGV